MPGDTLLRIQAMARELSAWVDNNRCEIDKLIAECDSGKISLYQYEQGLRKIAAAIGERNASKPSGSGSMQRRYLGDGVYIEFDGSGFWLITSDGISDTNRIYIDLETYQALKAFVREALGVQQ